MTETQQLGLAFQAPARKIYPVGELVAAVRTQVERAFTDVYVEGEISNYRPAGSGHFYFSLKDGSAQLRVVMWRTQARLLRFKPDNGMQVIARGRVTIYDERGDLQFQAEHLEPKGAGALQIAFEQLKSKLAAEGLFDPGRKKPIPALPRRIGVVTSPHGAAIQDMLNILRRRHESVNVVIYPAQVQGDAAASEVSAGVRWFNRHGKVDVIVIARGGGSFEDLLGFNDEALARVIAASEMPVISAVGHETDFTICDFRCRPARADSFGGGGAGDSFQAGVGREAPRHCASGLRRPSTTNCSARTMCSRNWRSTPSSLACRTPSRAASNALTIWSSAWRKRSRAF